MINRDILKKLIFTKVLPHNVIKNKVLFESNGPYDNGYALFIYAIENRKDLDCYFIAPFKTKDSYPIEYKKHILYYGDGCSLYERIRYFMNINTFSHIFSSYGFSGSVYLNSKKVFLCHGIGIKAAKEFMDDVLPKFDKVIIPTRFVADSFIRCFNVFERQITILQSPRKSLIKLDDNLKNKLFEFLNISKDNKIVLFMTTIRRLSDGNVDGSKIFTIDIELERLNYLLESKNMSIIVKLHHGFDNVDISEYPHLSNIRLIKNKDLLSIGINPTSLLVVADAFVTDYSSAATDFLYLNRPIGYLIPDFDSFKHEVNGNFLFDSPELFMPGEKFVDQDGLEVFLDNVSSGNDNYIYERKHISDLMNGNYPDDSVPEKEIIDYFFPNKHLDLM